MALMRKYLVHVSSNPKTLCSSRESMLWGVCEFSGDFWVYFPEGLVKLREIRNIEDLVKF